MSVWLEAVAEVTVTTYPPDAASGRPARVVLQVSAAVLEKRKGRGLTRCARVSVSVCVCVMSTIYGAAACGCPTETAPTCRLTTAASVGVTWWRTWRWTSASQ